MTDHNPSAGNGPARPSLSDCQHEAVILAGVVEALSLMDNEGEHFKNARTSVTRAALRLANALAENLEDVQREDHRHD